MPQVVNAADFRDRMARMVGMARASRRIMPAAVVAFVARVARVSPARRRPRWPRLSPFAQRVEHMVQLSDSALPIPGTRVRVGLDPLLGLLFPVVGDALGGVVSLGVMFLAVQYRVPPKVITRMVVNVAVDAAVGSIPIVGDIFDFGWKANDRNFELLMTHRGDMPKRTSVGYWLHIGALLSIGLACIAAPIALVVWLLLRAGYLGK